MCTHHPSVFDGEEGGGGSNLPPGRNPQGDGFFFDCITTHSDLGTKVLLPNMSQRFADPERHRSSQKKFGNF